MKKLYVAYGSNLNKQQMRYRCPNAVPYATGILADYELLFKGSKTGSYATVEPCMGASVPVAVWSINESDERSLDRYEGFPTFYYKKDVIVRTTKGNVKAMVYIMHEERPLGIPSEHYVDVCLEGYDDFDLNKMEFYDALLTTAAKLGAVDDRGDLSYDYGEDF